MAATNFRVQNTRYNGVMKQAKNALLIEYTCRYRKILRRSIAFRKG